MPQLFGMGGEVMEGSCGLDRFGFVWPGLIEQDRDRGHGHAVLCSVGTDDEGEGGLLANGAVDGFVVREDVA